MARTVRRSKDEVFEAAQRAYKSFHRRIQPIYPWVLVRVLPKEQQLGKLWMPESQNKILYEGVVLETWQPFDKLIDVHYVNDNPLQSVEERMHIESCLNLGDHVIFPHFEGMPVPYLNEEEKDAYRLIRETNSRDEKCEIYGKLEYQEPIEEQIREYFGKYHSAMNWQEADEVIKGLLRDFYVVRKTAEPRTTSGYNGPR